MLEFYVYQYVDEQDNPYYIGKGKGNRIKEKHLHTVVPPKERRIIIESNLTEEQALDLESKLIRTYGRKIDGGVLDNIKLNQWACLSGWKHSQETKKKISDSTIGKSKTEDTKQKMRKPKTEEHAEKIRQANLGRKNDGRYTKMGVTKSKQRWYTNGDITRMFEPGKELTGYKPGRKVGV